MKIVDISCDLYKELGEPSTISIPVIAFWLRSNVGSLNNALNTDFSIDSSSLEIQQKIDDVATDIKIEEAGVFKKMYIIHYYNTQIRTNIVAGTSDSVVEVASDGMRVRKTSKSQMLRELNAIKRLEVEELNRMINFYKTNKAAPRQVAGNDTTAGFYDPYGDSGLSTSYNRT